MALNSHVIYACYQNMPKNLFASQNMNWMRCYIHSNEQPVVFIPYMLCHFAAHWWFYIYRACAETSFGKFITPEKCKRYIGWGRLTASYDVDHTTAGALWLQSSNRYGADENIPTNT